MPLVLADVYTGRSVEIFFHDRQRWYHGHIAAAADTTAKDKFTVRFDDGDIVDKIDAKEIHSTFYRGLSCRSSDKGTIDEVYGIRGGRTPCYVRSLNVRTGFSFVMEPDDCWLDVGAHIGAFATFVCEEQESASVIAVEPSKANFAFLGQNCAQFGLRLTTLKSAVLASHEASVDLHIHPTHPNRHTVYEPTTKKMEWGLEKVRAHSLDVLRVDSHVALIFSSPFTLI